MMSSDEWDRLHKPSKFAEWATFLFVTVILFPGLAVAFVGGYGFVVWMMQVLNGPPVAG